ncbi:glycosyltransferase family 1 protein [bacterium]|nr:glycosyltransferase family 1 protein [bacterium]
MRVGIYTHYAHCDQAYFCIRLVELLRSRGVEFDIYADNAPGKLKIPYDSAVTYRQNVKFTDWVKKQTVVVWTQVPKIEQVNYANRMNKLTILVPMWQDLVPPYKKVMRRADYLVAMSAECKELYRDVFNIKTSVFIPYDAGLPVTRKESTVDPKNVRVFLPWFDRNARCANSDFLSSLAHLVEMMPNFELTAAIMSSRFSPGVAKFFQTLNNKTAGRVKLLRNIPFYRRTTLYGAYDLTLFPAECDNYGFCGLTSVNCGTPVLSFAVSPQLDYIYPNENGVLVRTKSDYDENGVPHAVPDYAALTEVLQALIDEPRLIDNLSKKVSYNLLQRRKAFEGGWTKLLNLE